MIITLQSSLKGKALENKELGLMTVCDSRYFAIRDILEQLVNKGFYEDIQKGKYICREVKKCTIKNQYGTVLFKK